MSIDRWKRIWGISGSQDNGANQFVVNLNESVLPPEKLTSMTFRLDTSSAKSKNPNLIDGLRCSLSVKWIKRMIKILGKSRRLSDLISCRKINRKLCLVNQHQDRKEVGEKLPILHANLSTLEFRRRLVNSLNIQPNVICFLWPYEQTVFLIWTPL